LDLTAPVSLVPGTSAFRIEYTALSYHAPELVQFKYRLIGVDTDWQDAGSRRDISYTKMTPGDYQLQIAAVDGMGQWSVKEIGLIVRIPPTFIQSRYFDALCVVFGGIFLYLIYRLRLNLATQRNAIRVTERERIARALHDSFLQSVHGLVMVFQTALSSLSSESEARNKIERVLTLADRVIEEGRDEVQELRSSLMTEGNLPKALEVVGTLLQDTSECAFTVRVEGAETKLRETVLREAYNIGRESLINAFRHANAERVDLVLGYTAENFTMQVNDNGSGIPAETLARGNAQGRWGLLGMRERTEQLDGALEVTSDSSGTRIRMTVPASRAYANLARVQRWWWAFTRPTRSRG
jgi:signal transduction histidine kinase